MHTLLYRSAAIWTVLGLISGLFYRELTKSHDFTGSTQLAVAHTHALALGTLMMLVLLALVAAFEVRDARFGWGVIMWQIGLAVTFGAQVVKGSLQVLESGAADAAALAGIAGLGHIVLSLAFLLLFVGLRPAVRSRALAESKSGH